MENTENKEKHNSKTTRNADLVEKRDADPKRWTFAALGELYNITAPAAYEIYKREKAKKKETELPRSLQKKYPNLAK